MRTQRSGQPSVAIVGAGLMGGWHAAAAKRAGGRVVAVVDGSLARARDLAARFPGCLAAASIEAAAERTPDVVHICTPSPTHEAIARASLLQGCHVLVEKPIASSAAATNELLTLAREKQRLVCPVHQFVFQRGVQQVLARQKELGDLLHVSSVACSAGAEGQSADASDTVALEILPHPLSLLDRFAQGALDRMRWSAARPQPGELRIAGHDDAITAGFLVSMHSRPTANEMTIFGTKGAAHLDLFHGFASFESGPTTRATKMRRPFDRAAGAFVSAGSNLTHRAIKRQPAYPGLWELVERFYRAVESKGAPPFEAAGILSVARTLETLRDLVLAGTTRNRSARQVS